MVQAHGDARANKPRPLTRCLYRHTSAGQDVPLFRCPSDWGTPVWEKGRNSIYRICGNSYYLNNHGRFEDTSKSSRVSPSTIVLYYEGNVDWLLGFPPANLPRTDVLEEITSPQQGIGWHGQWSRFNVGFRDLHAGNTYMDTRRMSGPGWNVAEFLKIWGFRVKS